MPTYEYNEYTDILRRAVKNTDINPFLTELERAFQNVDFGNRVLEITKDELTLEKVLQVLVMKRKQERFARLAEFLKKSYIKKTSIDRDSWDLDTA